MAAAQKEVATGPAHGCIGVLSIAASKCVRLLLTVTFEMRSLPGLATQGNIGK